MKTSGTSANLSKMPKRCKDLPDECWEIVFDKMGHHSHLQTLTLVCKQFLYITRHLRTTFNLTFPAILTHGENLSFILNQFPNIKTVNLRQAGDSAPRLLDQIAMSSLNVESLDISECPRLSLNRLEVLGQKMKSLRVLRCSKMPVFYDDKLATIASCVPWLEELDISYSSYRHVKNVDQKRVTDSGIEMISLKMKRLRKIDISGYYNVTNKSLVALSSNCLFLEQVVCNNCFKINDVGIQFIVENSPNLTFVSVRGIYSRKLSSKLSFKRALCLSMLNIHGCCISNKCLYSLSTPGMPLKSLTLNHCRGFSSHGIADLLKRHPLIEYLNLSGSTITDHTFNLKKLANCFSKLTTIKLKKCKVGVSTFFMLAKCCPVLKDIDMEDTRMGEVGVNTIYFASNPSMRNMRMGKGVKVINFASNPCIKSLNLSRNLFVDNKFLAILAVACPSLEILDVSFCSKITKNRISNLMKQCSNIRHLEINECKGINNIGKDGELPKLEVLRAKSSGIDDKGLALIGKRCNELLCLDLEDCQQVTTKGLKDMLEHCPRLREINIKQCDGMSEEIVDWMVFTRPSLRKIVPPTSSHPDVCQMQFYIRNGCYVWMPPKDKKYDDSLSSSDDDSSSSSDDDISSSSDDDISSSSDNDSSSSSDDDSLSSSDDDSSSSSEEEM